MVKKLIVLTLVLTFSVVLSACKKDAEKTAETQTNTQASPTAESQNTISKADVEIVFSDSGFTPNEARVKAGQSLKWTNNSGSEIQVGSDPHPVHTDNKDITGGEFTLNLQPGESKTIIVATAGSWNYHDHLNSAIKGKVIVE